MKKYQFRLDAVLRVRRIEEERARADLLGANRALAEAEAELDRRLEHYRTVTLPGGALAHDDYVAARSRQDHAAASVVAAGTARLAAEAERSRLHDIWAGTAARVKALERLDDRRREEHAAEVLREEVIVLDEVATATRLIGAQAMTGTDAMAQVKARMAQIEARFGVNRPPRATTTSSNGDFQSALAAAQSQLGGGSSVPVLGAGNVSGADVVQGSLKYLGVPYKWGGTDPATGLDCSGFVQQVYEDLGVALPRVSRDQAKAGTPVADLSKAQPGDLVAFGTPVDHIGIYVGNGRMIEAPHTGDVVKIADVPSDWTAIRRILPDPAATASLAGASPYASLFEASAAKHNVSASVLQAMAKAESGFDPNAVSKAGAEGLMQLMPGTAKGLGVNPFDPAQAIDGAASLLAGNLKRFGSLDQALAAYNAGPAAVQRYGGVPPYAETQGYVRRILSDLRTEVS